MGRTQEAVHDLLRNLRSLDGLKELFRSQLNYDLVNLPISRQEWPESAASSLAEDPRLLARHEDFHIIYIHLKGPLRLTPERNIVNRLLRDHPYALFIFSDDRQQNWHFVNVKLVADRDEEKNRDEKRRRLFRRIAVGPEERLRTATERLSLLDLEAISSGKKFLSPLDIQQAHDEAFDVEKVTNQFFSEYQAVIQTLRDDLNKQTKDLVWAHGYALQFLNRLMFLYFIQRKRWLGNNPVFMADFWKGYQDSGLAQNTFFDKWLRVLFFEAFNNKFHGGHTQFPQEIRKALALAPYLNGGLFQENDLDRKTRFTISDQSIQQIFEFLEGYNFTIAEDSPLDQEVAVDPEMIGRVYESLVNVSTELDTRGDAGIFYTPRTEIDLMCRLALVDNLANHLGEDKKNLFYELVFALVPDEKEEADRKITAAQLWAPIEQHLQSLTVLDPACGSGSFLVGMLHILDDLQERAGRQLGKVEDPYERKKRIIGQNLYGVDIMEWACRVAELRLWLALIIDVEFPREDLHVRTEPLLPDFTFNIRPGDSLVQEVGGINLGHRRGDYDLSPALKARITRLKTEKLKFYRNEAGRQFLTADQAKQEELRLFRDILDHRKHGLQNRAAQLRQMMAGMQIRRLEGTIEASPKREEWGKELEEITSALANLEQAHEALRGRTELPFVWDIAFVEIFGGEGRGFDIVIGNPPYVRQENISDPRLPREQVTADNKREYKAKLARSVYHAFPRFFGYKPAAAAPAHKLDGKSDLYIYFYFHGLSLLNPQGSFCFITSNSWLDVGYGADLQEFLLKHCRVRLILDNQAKRSFASADVNTVIALLSAPDDRREWALNQTARFVMFKVPFEHILSPVIFQEIEEARERHTTPEYRVFPLSQEALLEDGSELAGGVKGGGVSGQKKGRRTTSGPLIKVARYIGNKWGGKYLRAPEIYYTIMDRGKGKFVKIATIAEVNEGKPTGANDFFFPTEETVRRFLIEDRYLMPGVMKTRGANYFILKKANINRCFLAISVNRNELMKSAGAYSYVRYGEEIVLNKRNTFRNKKDWYKFDIRKPADLIMPCGIGETFFCSINQANAVTSNSFTEIRLIDKNYLYPAWSWLNSIIGWLIVELTGRSSLGGGMLKADPIEYRHMPILRKEFFPDRCEFLDREVQQIKKEINKPDRCLIDDIIFDELKLSKGEREAVYEAVIQLVNARLSKAESLDLKERRKRLAAAEKTGGIWAGLPEEEDNGE